MKILVLDDYRTDREMLAEPFLADHEVKCAGDLHEAELVLKNWWPDVALVDAIFPKTRNSSATFAFEAFLDLIESKRPLNLEMPQVVMISGQNDAAKRFDDVRQWLVYGRVADVIPKSTANVGVNFFKAVVRMRVENLLDRQRWRTVESNAQSASEWFAQFGIISKSPTILDLKKHLTLAARSPLCVLLTGNPGTGKELFAAAIHNLARPGKRYRPINCAAISPELFEPEIFGTKQVGRIPNPPYVEKIGILEDVLDGTVFFDEIHRLRPGHQGQMLRVLEDRKFRKTGATRDTPFLAKFVSATNINIDEEVAKGAFPTDLYWRIAGYEIKIPDLADRREDIPILVDYFLKKFTDELREKEMPCPNVHLDDRCRDLLLSAPWPGNVRELRNVVKKTVDYAVMERGDDPLVISLELLLDANPSLRSLTPPVSTSDKLLEKSGAGVQRWSELDENKLVTIVEAIQVHLSDAGRTEFEKFQAALRPRDPDCDDKALGRKHQDPAVIHCLKALLFILLRPENSTTVQDLMPILDLRWAQAKKVLEVLAAEEPSNPQYAAFVKLPSRGRQRAQIMCEMIKPKDLIDAS
jgi:DNA-binding NtrC family response regulator